MVKNIFDGATHYTMNKELHQEIKKLKDEIQKQENNVIEAAKICDNRIVDKGLGIIESNLKYLSILVNGVPIDEMENRKIRDFLMVHYENLCKLSLPA